MNIIEETPFLKCYGAQEAGEKQTTTLANNIMTHFKSMKNTFSGLHFWYGFDSEGDRGESNKGKGKQHYDKLKMNEKQLGGCMFEIVLVQGRGRGRSTQRQRQTTLRHTWNRWRILGGQQFWDGFDAEKARAKQTLTKTQHYGRSK